MDLHPLADFSKQKLYPIRHGSDNPAVIAKPQSTAASSSVAMTQCLMSIAAIS